MANPGFSLLVEAQTQWVNKLNLMNTTVLVYDQPHHYYALIFFVASYF